MKAPGAILLVACYELGHQPLAVAWPAAFLERAGYTPAVMDVSVEPFDVEKARAARLVAISVPMHTALRLGVTVAERVRAVNPSVHICFFGLYASLNADHLLYHAADSVIGGEIESALVELARSVVGGGDGATPGVARRHQPAPAILTRLPFPRPSRSRLPSLKKYAHLERDGQRVLAGYVEATRGCLHLCRHCPIPPVYGGRFFAVPRDVVLDDVGQLVDAGAQHITFGDPDFLNGPGHALAIARDLHARFPEITFDFTAKIEHLLRHRDRLGELATFGCVFIVSAVESLSDVVLRHLDKGHTRADVMTVLRAVRDTAIALRPTWVPFTPWTTIDDYRDMLDFIASEELVDHVDPVQYTIRLLVPPRSLLLDSPAMQPHLAGLVATDFSHAWRHPDPRMDRLHEQVSTLVADAADRTDDAAVTFDAVRRLADEIAGAAPRGPAMPPDPARARPPRLTEPWFC
jgi:radical SAM superfamily enzyme YgiQ (UPF0313 family)